MSERLADLGSFFLRESAEAPNCLTRSELSKLAVTAMPSLDPMTRKHLDICPRCAHVYSALRGAHCCNVMPSKWSTALQIHSQSQDSTWDHSSVLFRINIDTREVELSYDQDEWLSTPLHIRVALDVDVQADLVSVAVSEVPPIVHVVSFVTPVFSKSLHISDHDGLFRFLLPLSEVTGTHATDTVPTLATLFDWLNKGNVTVAFTADPTAPSRTRALLDTVGAIERDFDYQLPSGLHSDTFINVGTLCRSEETLGRIAVAFDALFRDTLFDTIAVNGWAMSTIARRIAERRSVGRRRPSICEVTFEGYDQPSLSGDVLRGSRVLILTDVNVTGRLSKEIESKVVAAGAQVVGRGALVQAMSPLARADLTTRALCHVPMTLIDPKVQKLSHCSTKEMRAFNPVSCAMTQRAPCPRSPSQFLTYDHSAQEFWEYVNIAGAYEHHRKEGNKHYIAFVDTKRLLEYPEIGTTLVGRLRDRILESARLIPKILLVPDRARSRLLAQMLQDALQRVHSIRTITTVLALRRARGRLGRGSTGAWVIPKETKLQLHGADVLIVDAAAGDGATIDILSRAAGECHARAVGAAVLVSRLTEGCEQAFESRLTGGFHRLFRLPIRPITIRGEDPSLCPVCRRAAAIKEVGRSSSVEAVKRWSEQLGHRFPKRPVASLAPSERQMQLLLFPTGQEFLENCRQSVASGVTLHALNAAMTNGMARLTLPELQNGQIPSRNRAAMVQNLPQSALEWSGDVLVQDLVRFLGSQTTTNIWRAAAEVLARSGSEAWVSYVSQLVQRLYQSGKCPSVSFWSHIACTAYLTTSALPSMKTMVRAQFSEILSEVEGTPYADGLQVVLDTIGQ